MTCPNNVAVDYMYQRWVFTLDPARFPLELVRELVNTLHNNDQHYVVMVDPAVAHQPNKGYEAFDKGVVWPGVTVFPDWFKASTQDYWNDQFLTFFNPDTGVDIDAL
jgi:alpha-glucosidase